MDHKIKDCFGNEVSVTERLARLRKLADGRQSRWQVGTEGWRREQAVKDALDRVLSKKTYVPVRTGGRVFIIEGHKK
jgi:hypothetical protein